jgi:hypothetical protein
LLLSEKWVQKSAKLFHCNLANPWPNPFLIRG